MRAKACISTAIILFILLIPVLTEASSNHDDGHRLLSDLLSLHDHEFHSKLRPVNNTSQTLHVKFGMAINQLIDVNEYHQVITTSVWIRLFWRDEILQWDPDIYNGTEIVYIPSDYIWKPDLVLYNTADTKIHITSDEIIAILRHTGDITYMFPAQFMSSCQMYFKHYPFDEQVCHLKFGSWAYGGLKLDLHMLDDYPADYRNYNYNSAWGLVNFTAARHVDYYGCCPNDPYPDITFTITLRRRYEMQVFYLIIPNLLINITALMQFILPCDSGERITLGITIYLSMVVYLLLIQQLIPTSEKIPVLVSYIVTTLMMVTVSQVTSILVLRLHHNGTHDNDLQVPPWARRFLLHGLARLLCMHDLIVPDEIHETKLSVQVSSTALVGETVNDLAEVDSEAEIEVKKESLNTLSTVQSVESPKSIRIKANQVSPIQQFQEKLRRGSKGSTQLTVDQERPRDKRRSSVNILGATDSTTIIKRSDLKKNKELLLYKILRHVEEMCEHRATECRLSELRCEWQQMAMLIDRFMLYVFIALTFLVWVVFFCNIPNRDEDVLI